MNNAVYGKAMENLRKMIDVKLVSNRKNYLKWISKPSYMSHKIFDNNLVAIRKNKVTLMLITHSIMITLKINMATTQNCYSQTMIL